MRMNPAAADKRQQGGGPYHSLGLLPALRLRELMMGMKMPPARAVVEGMAGAISASATAQRSGGNGQHAVDLQVLQEMPLSRHRGAQSVRRTVMACSAPCPSTGAMPWYGRHALVSACIATGRIAAVTHPAALQHSPTDQPSRTAPVTHPRGRRPGPGWTCQRP